LEKIKMSNTVDSEKALRDTYEHIHLVQKLLASVQYQLMRRQFTHDRSKLASPEWEYYQAVTHNLKGLTYGTLEYTEQLKRDLGPALAHHYAHNRHHPEFFEDAEQSSEIEQHIQTMKHVEQYLIKNWMPDEYQRWQKLEAYLEESKRQYAASINNMDLIDLLEMIVDWLAAVQRHADGDIQKSIEINEKRFNLSHQLVNILRNTAAVITDEFEGLNTQRDL
jgi:hypothetical protein